MYVYCMWTHLNLMLIWIHFQKQIINMDPLSKNINMDPFAKQYLSIMDFLRGPYIAY